MENIKATDPRLADVFRCAKRVFVFTGAGISKESGLPTFRDADGLWKKYDPMTLATMEAFNRDPVAVWNIYLLRHRQIEQAQPNLAHIILAKMEEHYPDFLITTQNVDNLHERAGSRKLVKLHGDAGQMRCLDCGEVFNIDDFDLPDEFALETLPKCTTCDGLCRPNIVWFGEYVPEVPMMASINAAASCDLMLIIGTSGEVSGGYGFAEYAMENGATIIDINPTQSALTGCADFWISQPAGESMPVIWELITERFK